MAPRLHRGRAGGAAAEAAASPPRHGRRPGGAWWQRAVLAQAVAHALGTGPRLAAADASCPAGFDESKVEERKKWRCASKVIEETGEIEFDQGCLHVQQQRDYWGFPEPKDECEQYWKDGSGLWFRLTVNMNASEYLDCKANYLDAILEKYGDQVYSWPAKRKLRKQVEADKECLKQYPKICEFENFHFGRCSEFYEKMIAPRCVEQGGMEEDHRKKFCAEACPPPEDEVEIPENVTEEELENCTEEKVQVNPFKVKRKKVCPIRKVATAVKETATKVAQWVSSSLSNLIGAPEPAGEEEKQEPGDASAETDGTEVAAAAEEAAADEEAAASWD